MLSLLLFCIVLKVLTSAIREEKVCTQIEKERNKTVYLHKTGEGNGNPLQYSCLENPKDRGAWRTAICGVAESDTTAAT